MPSAGYSGTPLAQKLGIKPGQRVSLFAVPKDYKSLLQPLPEKVSFSNRIEKGATFVHAFFSERKTLEKTLKRLRTAIADNGIVWVSWPKKSSGVPTDVTEDVIRAEALPIGLVDIKVCAVNEIWSGLKLVIRRENRH